MIDYMAIGLVVFFGILGIVAGSLLQILRLGAAVASIIVSLKYSPAIADAVPMFGKSMMMREYGLPVMLFAILYMLMALIIKLLVDSAVGPKPKISPVSRIVGGVLGGLNGLVLTWFIVAVALTAQANSGRQMVVMDAERSHFVKFVGEHPVPGLTRRSGGSGLDEMKVEIRQVGEGRAAIPEGIEKAVQDAGKASEKALEKIDQIGKGAVEAIENVGDKGGKIVDEASEKAAQAGNEVVKKAAEATDDAARAGNEAVDKVGEAARKAGESLDGKD